MSNTSCTVSKKTPLITSRDLFHRIKHDEQFNPLRVKIWYQDRFREDLLSSTFTGWKTIDHDDGIPWTRVYRFTYGDQILWDRETRTYCPEVVLSPPDSKPLLQYDPETKKWLTLEKWVPETLPEDLTLASFNIMFDLYQPEKTDLKPRLPLIAEELERQLPTVIHLQEVVPQSWEFFKGQKWVQENYYILDVPFKKYGQMTLSQVRPDVVQELIFNPMKRAIMAQFQDCHRRSLQLYNIHLTSAQAKNSAEKRAEQFDQMIETFDPNGTVIMMGDFNCDEKEIPMDKLPGFQDLWSQLHPDDPGYTFNTEINELAKLICGEKTVQMRIDRIMYRSFYPLHLEQMHLFAQDPSKGQYLSDHLGLFGELSFGERAKRETFVAGCYLAVIPPLHLWSRIQKLRRRHDDNYLKHPPHLTVFEGQLPLDKLVSHEGFRSSLQSLKIAPLRLKQTGYFGHVKNCTWVLFPEEPQVMRHLRNHLNTTMRVESDYRPHLTLGKFPSEGQVLSVMRTLPKDHLQMEFPITHLCYLRKKHQTYYQMIHRFDRQEWDPEGQKQMIGWMKNLLELVGYEKLELVGSRALLMAPNSDLDLLVTGKLTEDEFLLSFVRLGQMASEFDWCYVAPARIPTIMIRTRGGQEINLVYQSSLEPRLDRAQMVGDVEEILARVDPEVYRPLLQKVREWAQVRGLYGFGYPKGIVYALWVASLWKEDPPKDVKEGMSLFFERMINHPWPAPIQLKDQKFEPTHPADFLLPTLSPINGQNVNRNMGRSTSTRMAEEWLRGLDLGDRDELWEPRKREGVKVQVQLKSCNLQALGPAQGHLKGTLMQLWTILEKTGVEIDPGYWEEGERDELTYHFYVSGRTDTLDEYQGRVTRMLASEYPEVACWWH